MGDIPGIDGEGEISGKWSFGFKVSVLVGKSG
jgi:hypothetical protein